VRTYPRSSRADARTVWKRTGGRRSNRPVWERTGVSSQQSTCLGKNRRSSQQSTCLERTGVPRSNRPVWKEPALLAAIDRLGKNRRSSQQSTRLGKHGAPRSNRPVWEKPALLAAKVLARNGTRTFTESRNSHPSFVQQRSMVSHDCQRDHRSEKYDALQHGSSLLYLSASPHLTPTSTHT